MTLNEKTDTDQLVRKFLNDINVDFDEQGSNNVEIREALQSASKSKRGTGIGKPEFVFFSGDYPVVVEDKQHIEKLIALDESGRVITDYPDRKDYAVNGAVHYALNIVNKTLSYHVLFLSQMQ